MPKITFKRTGIIIIILVVTLIAYNLVAQIFQALNSGDRLNKEAEELFKLELKNKELKNKLSQTKSLEFLEEMARDKLNLAKKGETIVVIPEEKIQEVLGTTKASEEQKLPNWQGWLKLFI